jgi:DnaJ-domain-containing protein 1
MVFLAGALALIGLLFLARIAMTGDPGKLMTVARYAGIRLWPAGHPDHETSPQRPTSTMTRAEALKVLGLPDDADEDDIRAAHRKLIMSNHPDKGGSDYLASKINEAKDVLLP